MEVFKGGRREGGRVKEVDLRTNLACERVCMCFTCEKKEKRNIL